MEFYTYIWRDADGVPFYVGKGQGRRAWNISTRSDEFKAIFDRGGCTVDIVDEFIHESQAYEHEVSLVAKYGRADLGAGTLVNKTNGGDAPEAMCGEKNGNHNPVVYNWVNYRTGEEDSGTLLYMHEKYGGSRPTWTSVANGDKPSVFGWLLLDKRQGHKGSEKGQAFSFVNRDGRSFVGTQSEFCKFASTNATVAHRVAVQRGVSRCGWRLADTQDRSHNAPRSGGRPGKPASTFTISKGSVIATGDARALAYVVGGTAQRVWAGIRLIKSGKAKTYKGWRLVSHGPRNQLAGECA